MGMFLEGFEKMIFDGQKTLVVTLLGGKVVLFGPTAVAVGDQSDVHLVYSSEICERSEYFYLLSPAWGGTAPLDPSGAKGSLFKF